MSISTEQFGTLFSQDKLDAIFPPERSNQFFDALLGDPEEGAYDIRLSFSKAQNNQLHFNLELHQRPGKCLACHLTYGLPAVFQRHPVINIKGVVKAIEKHLMGRLRCSNWSLGATREVSPELHVVPLFITVTSCS